MLETGRTAAGSKETGGRRSDVTDRSVEVVSPESGLTKGKDYRNYSMTSKDWLVTAAQAGVLSLGVAWLFYRTPLGLLSFAGLFPIFWIRRRSQGISEQQRRLGQEFKEAVRVITASLYTGYSVENAFGEAEKELELLLGPQADISKELHSINQQIRLNVPVETLLQDLAGRSGVEEIFGFGQVFGYAKRNGSSFIQILQDTTDRIGEKLELEREIQTMLSSKRLEQRIMNLIPMGILLFVDMTSPGFLQVMYSGLLGRLVMTICLLLYGGAYLLSEWLMNIRI